MLFTPADGYTAPLHAHSYREKEAYRFHSSLAFRSKSPPKKIKSKTKCGWLTCSPPFCLKMAFNSSPRIVINISRAQSRSRDLPSKITKTKMKSKRKTKNKTQLLSFDFWAIGEGLNIPRNKVARVMWLLHYSVAHHRCENGNSNGRNG